MKFDLAGITVKSDASLGALGMCLALASASFPIYIYFNEEKFGPPQMQYAAVEGGGGEAETRTPRFEDILVKSPELQLDEITTGTVANAKSPGDAKTEAVSAAGPQDSPKLDSVITGAVSLPGPRTRAMARPPEPQPFPEELKPFKILYVSSGRALVLDEGEIEVVRTNSRLSDGSRVLSIQNSDAEWQIVTSGNRVLKWAKPAS